MSGLATTNAGVPLSLIVQALDASGAPNPSYTGTVQFSSTDPALSIPTYYRYTFTTADAGQHTFSATFNTAGPAQTVTVSDVSTPSTTGTSPSVAVGETRYSVSVTPTTIMEGYGNNVTIAVQALDSSNAPVTGYQGTINLGSSYGSAYYWGGGADSSGRYTFTAADAGSHSFTAAFTAAGNETISATD